LKTKNYYLKEIEPSDIDFIHQGLSNVDVTKYYDVHYKSLEETKVQMEWFAKLKEEGTGLWWGVFDKETHVFCGAGGYNDLNKKDRRAEIGFWLLPEYWGKEILKEVAPKLLELGFTTLNLNRVEAYVEHENVKCKNALKKINLVHEGTMRAYEIKEGKEIDLEIYAVLRRDWESLRII